MTTLLLAGLLAAPAGSWDGSGAVGLALAPKSTTIDTSLELGFGLWVGRQFPPWLRGEVALSSTTAGRKKGVDAVAVSGWTFHLSALGGLSHPFFESDDDAVGVDLLVGPALRLTRAAISVYDETTASWSARVVAHGAFGVYAQLGPWRLALRYLGELPDPYTHQICWFVGRRL